MKIKVFYDFHDDGVKPMMMVLQFRRGEIQWDKSFLTVRLNAPYQRQFTEEYQDGTVGTSVLLEDLVINPETPDCFKVHLTSIKTRCHQNELDLIEQFVIRMTDIEEVLQSSIWTFYEWRD